MTIRPPSTNLSGNDGRAGFRDVNFKTPQDLAIEFTKVGKRYHIRSISLISKNSDTISNGATVLVNEVNTGTDVDAEITLTSNGVAPADGTTVLLGNKTYTGRDLVKATSTLISNGVTPANGKIVTIDGVIFTARTTLTPTEGEVLIGGSAAVFLDNLKSAVNHTGTPGTDYSCAAAHATVLATTNTNTTQLFQARDAGTAGNAITVSTDIASTTFDTPTLVGGTDPTVEGEVKIGGTAAIFLDNLKAAVNHAAGAGTLYFAAAAHTQITGTTNTDTTQLFVANVGAASGRAGNDLTGVDNSATLSWSNSGAFTGGIDGTLVNALVDSTNLVDSDSTGLVQNLALRADAEVISGGNALMLHIRAGTTGTTDVKDVEIEFSVL